MTILIVDICRENRAHMCGVNNKGKTRMNFILRNMYRKQSLRLLHPRDANTIQNVIRIAGIAVLVIEFYNIEWNDSRKGYIYIYMLDCYLCR